MTPVGAGELARGRQAAAPAGRLDGVFNLVTGETFAMDHGWQTIDTITIADVNRDGVIDVLGRRASDSALLSYTHTGTWPPAPDGTAFTTLNAPVVVGYNWWINDVIT